MSKIVSKIDGATVRGGPEVPSGPRDGSSEAFPPECRLHRPAEFLACYRGRRCRGSLLMVVSVENGLGWPRLGLTASRKVGRAHQRNRLKRWVRESFRRSPSRRQLESRDYVVHFFPQAQRVTFQQVEQELWKQLLAVPRPRRSQRGRRRPSRDR